MSPIHDQSYRRYQGTRTPVGRGWTVIAGTGLKTMLGKRVFLAVMLLAWVPFIVRAVQIYFVTMMPAAAQAVPVDVQMFQDFVEQQGFFIFIVTVYVGAGIIANDRRANALQIYLSKPIFRVEYIAGKLAVLVFYLLMITVVPGLLLILMQIMFSGSLAFVQEHPIVVPAVVLASLVRVVVSAMTILALSSLSKSSRYVATLFTGAIFFTEAIFGVLSGITGSTRAAWISITANLEQVTDLIFRKALRYETPAIVSVLVLAGLVAVSISVLERRVKGVEVVK
jgi:ABC-type transport system involved in multi-copper enzyme maturation permease subunit